jgi:HlyD family secretion protein
MKRKTIIASGIAAAVVVALGGGYAYSATNNQALVGVTTVTKAPLSVTVSASGKLVPAHTAGVYPPTSGTLASVQVSNGAAVKEGEVLARLDTAPLKLAVAQAKAAHAAALAQSEAVANAVPSSTERSAASETLAAARSQADTTAKNYSDYLSAYNAAPADQQPSMLANLRTLKSARSTANAAVKSAQAGITRLARAAQVSKARSAASQSISATAQAVKRAELNLTHAELTAPFAGTVTFAGTVEPGVGVSAGVAVFTVVDPKRMEFEAAVNETDITAVYPEQPASVSLDAFTDSFTGTVTAVQAAPQLTSTGGVSFAVRISVATGTARLFQGLSGSADIVTQSIPDAVVVPIESVLTKGSGTSVFVLGSDGIVAARTVTVGASTDTSAQILTGLSAGEQVVTTGASGLSNGQRVRTK